ncbi:MAG: tol-pal system protein YbgF [Pseudomonadota bacterium]
MASPLLKKALTGLVLVMLSASPPLQAQLFSDDEARRAIIDLRARIAQLEAENQTLSNRLDGMAKGQLELFSQIEKLRAEVANLRGITEQNAQSTSLAKQQQKELFMNLEKQIQSADARLKQFGPQSMALDGEEIAVAPEEKQAFEDIQKELSEKRFSNALKLLSSFNQQYGRSKLLPWTLSMEGATAYALRQYKTSIRAITRLDKSHPKHPRTPDALLTLASAYDESEQANSAKSVLQGIVKRFPDSEAARIATERLGASSKPTKTPAKK